MANKDREQEFARRLFGVDHLGQLNLQEDAQWRDFLRAVDYAIETHPASGNTIEIE
jgi:hypothetical protein